MQLSTITTHLLVALATITSLPANASSLLTATHHLVSAAPTADGIEVTLDVVVRNDASTKLIDVRVTPTRSPLTIPTAVSAIVAESIMPGEEIVMTWTFTTRNSPDSFLDGTLFAFTATGKDAYGAYQYIDFDSAAE